MTNSGILDFAIQGFKFDCSIVNLMKQWYQKNNSSYPKTLNIMYKLPFYGVSSFSVDHNGTTAAILDFVHTGFKFNCSNDNLIKYQHQKWIPHTLKPLKSCTGRPYMVLILIFCWPNSTTAAILDFVVLCVKFDCYNDNLITQKHQKWIPHTLKPLKSCIAWPYEVLADFWLTKLAQRRPSWILCSHAVSTVGIFGDFMQLHSWDVKELSLKNTAFYIFFPTLFIMDA